MLFRTLRVRPDWGSASASAVAGADGVVSTCVLKSLAGVGIGSWPSWLGILRLRPPGVRASEAAARDEVLVCAVLLIDAGSAVMFCGLRGVASAK